jgi:hypothetical protein
MAERSHHLLSLRVQEAAAMKCSTVVPLLGTSQEEEDSERIADELEDLNKTCGSSLFWL